MNGVNAVNGKLCKCGQPHDGWPGKDGGELCQMCWEKESSDSWWEMVMPLLAALEQEPEPRSRKKP